MRKGLELLTPVAQAHEGIAVAGLSVDTEWQPDAGTGPFAPGLFGEHLSLQVEAAGNLHAKRFGDRAVHGLGKKEPEVPAPS
jgi:hypothetical protein